MASLITGESLRVLLVSAREGARDEVGEALAGRAGDHRLYWVSQADLAAGRAQEVLPHVILVDDDLGGANPITLIGQLVSRQPGAAVLALVGPAAMAQARQAVLAGARAFITTPLQAEELLSALRQVLGQRAPQGEPEDAEAPQGRIIVFAAPKGGSGRTTLAVNTAISLHQLDTKSVVLVDADYAAPAIDVLLNLQGERDVSDLLKKIAQLDRDLVANILATHASGVRVLLAAPPAEGAIPLSFPQVQQLLVWLRRMFPRVVVDLGLPLDEAAFAFLDSADRIVMVALPEMGGLRNARLMLDQFRQRGYPEGKVRLVLNRETMAHAVPLSDIEGRLHVRVAYRIPDDQPLATFSINRGVPLIMSHSRSAVARAVRGFAKQLAQDLREPEPAADAGSRAGGLFGRLRKSPARTSEA